MKTGIFTFCLRSFSLIFFLATVTEFVTAQNTFPSTGAAGIGTTSPNTSSLLEIKSTSKGILIPRMTKTQRDAIVSPAQGLLIYQTNSAQGFYYYDGSSWNAVTPKNKGWSLTGNAGTDSSLNFIGTSDAHPLAFRVNNQKAGWIDFNGNSNTTFGYQGLLANTTGFLNTSIGSNTLKVNTTGGRNTGIGAYTLVVNNADNNTAIGVYALSANTSGINNTAAGVNALQANTTGTSNAAYGVNALYANTTGQQNTANGFAALISNSTGSYNTAIGTAALNSNTADYNTATGAYAMYLNTSGTNNTASGYSALYSNKTGVNNTAYGSNSLASNISGDNNIAIGYNALFSNIGNDAFTAGYGNTGIGNNSLWANTTGALNTSLGLESLVGNSTGNLNVAIGYSALHTNAAGYGNTVVGSLADVTSASLTNATAIGYNAWVEGSNSVRVGNFDIVSIGGHVGWTSFSDGRFKKNVKENVKGLIFINSLKPITYTIDAVALEKHFNRGSNNVDSKQSSPYTDQKSSSITYSGFVAQDVETAAKKINYDFSGIDKPQTKDGLYGLRYADFVVPLVKAVQELSKMNDDKDAKINELETRLARLETLLNVQSTSVSTTSLEQNIPNPFTNATVINYTLPQSISSAQIVITDKTGKTLKTVNITGGKGSLSVDASTLASGAYQYSLIANGKFIATKQMILAK